MSDKNKPGSDNNSNIESTPLVSFILVNHNGNEDTAECVKSIKSTVTYPNCNIIITDNSCDDAVYDDLCEKVADDATILRADDNNGFAAGCNMGIKKAKELGAAYIILLNNDTVIKSPDLVERLLSCFVKDRVGMAGGKILYYDMPDTVWYEAGYISKVRLRAKNRHADRKVYTSFITGCLQMISMKAIDSVGLMDEGYFLFYEDVEYCRRMTEMGYSLVYDPEAVIYHKVSRSAPSKTALSVYYSNRSRYKFIKRYEDGNILAKISFFFELFTKIATYDLEKKKKLLGLLMEITRGLR